MSLVSKVCSDRLGHIENESILKGLNKGSVNLGNYVDGEVSSHLVNVGKDIKAGGLLD